MFRSAFALNLRSLGVARITFAVLILFDLMQRSVDLVAHYTDFGLLPRVAIIEHPYSRWHWSVHLMSGTWQMQALLFVIAAFCAVFLLVGYHTKLATIASWALMVSLNNRNPIIVVGDTLFRALLFWAIFLPWGRRLSIDALRLSPDSKQASQTCFSPATIAYVMQLIFVFWFGVIHKSGVEWRSEGTALYYALSLEQFTTSFDYSCFNFHCCSSSLRMLPFGPKRSALYYSFFPCGTGLCVRSV